MPLDQRSIVLGRLAAETEGLMARARRGSAALATAPAHVRCAIYTRKRPDEGLDRDFNLRRLERYVMLVWESGARPVIVLSKRDICAEVDERVHEAERVAHGVPVVAISSKTGEGLEGLAGFIEPARTIALLGSSGAGKSTLLNHLAGRELQRTREVRTSDGRGRHTTSARELFVLDSGALLIDTPGMRELQLWAGSDALRGTFEDIEALAADCAFRDCGHEQEPPPLTAPTDDLA